MAQNVVKKKRKTKAELNEFLKTYPPNLRAIALRLRERVFQVEPDVIEQIDYPAHMLAYGLSETYKGMICVIIMEKNIVNLGLPRGTELADPAGLLEGTGKRARHVKVRMLEEAENPALVKLIQASAAQIR